MKEVNTILNLKDELMARANQSIFKTGDNVYFQSDDSLCAKYNRRTTKLVLGRDWKSSRTTLKYLKLFINGYTDYIYKNMSSFKKLIKQEKNIRIDNKMK